MKRTKRLPILLTESEFQGLEELAKLSGLSKAEYIRDLIKIKIQEMDAKERLR